MVACSSRITVAAAPPFVLHALTLASMPDAAPLASEGQSMQAFDNS